MSIVFRFPQVAISRDALESGLGMTLDRFETPQHGPLSYGQINIPEDGDSWAAAMALAERVGSAVLAFVERGEIGRPTADIAVPFFDQRVATSLLIPNAVAEVLGRGGFDIEMSIYLTNSN